ncbi:MAG: FKBP-type peptidyl-prolyl cis-trans isomerase [Pseudomonadota bacterium]
MLQRALSIVMVLAASSSFALAADASSSASASASAAVPAAITTLVIKDTQVGTGKEATGGSQVQVNYTGWLYDPKAPDAHGKQFDSSIGKAPFSFPLGGGRVIKGWDQGVAGMKVGGKRTLTIPSNLAYGKQGAGGVIPPDATLVFDVELLDVK